MSNFFAELKRRNIFRVAGVYAVVGWILMQVVSVTTPALKLPDWVDSFFAVTLIIGFPVAMLLAWAFEKRVARMAQNAAKHRAEIEAQLANPKPNWVKIVP